VQTISLPLADLVAIRDALNSSYYHNLALDMADSYRKLNRQNRGSAMTLAVKTALDTANNHIEQSQGGDDVPVSA